MATRSVRLDEEAETALAEIRRHSGASISAAIKLSLISFRDTKVTPQRRPADFFLNYDFGEGGDAIGPARNASQLVREKLQARRKAR